MTSKSLGIEEIVLFCISLFFLIWVLFFSFFTDNAEITLKTGLANITASLNLWLGGIAIFSLFFLVRVYLFFIKNGRLWPLFSYFGNSGLYLLRIFVLINSTTILGMLASGLIQQETKNRLINLHLLNADKFLSGDYPLLWLHSPSNALINILHFLTPAIIYSFLSMAMVMTVLAFVFCFDKNRNLFKSYIMNIFIAFALATPLWYLFPANAPVNYLLHNNEVYSDASLSQAITNYQPNADVAVFQEKIWENQKNALPVTTMPSMHWAWSIIIVYYLFKKWPKTIFLSFIWISFDLFGTIYLGNHYLLDGLVAIPLAVLAIFSANKFIKIKPRST